MRTIAGELLMAVVLGVLAVLLGLTENGLAAGIFAAGAALFAGSAYLLWRDDR